LFYGQHAKTLDDKDRVVVPADFRRALAGEGEPGEAAFFVTITPDEHRCLSLFEERQFERLFLDFEPHESFVDGDVRDYARMVVGRSHRVACDKQGRIHIPKYLKQDAGLSRDVVLVGLFDHAEIWSRDAWEKFHAERRGDFSTFARAVHRSRRDREAGRGS